MTETLQCVDGSPASISMSWSMRGWCEPGSIWGMFWLIVTPSVGVTISGLFNYPDYLGTTQLGLDLRPASADPCQRRDHGRLFVAVHRRMLLSGAAPMRRSRGLGTVGRAGGLGVEFGPHGRSRRAGLRLKSRARGRRAAAVFRNSDFHRMRDGDRAVPRHHRAAPRAAALRRALVSHRCLHMDDDESHSGQLHPALYDFRHQQRGIPRSLYPLHRRPVDHAGRLRAHLLLPPRQRAQSALRA